MLVNERASYSKRSRQIDIRYFFKKDKVDKKEFHVKYCSTKQMIADFYTKPVKGILFRRLSSVIMCEITRDELPQLVNAKERVGNSNCEQNAFT